VDSLSFHWGKFRRSRQALGLAEARVADSAKKGADRGIDGRKYFHDDNSGKSKQIILSVKAGENVNVAQVRDLRGRLASWHAAVGAQRGAWGLGL